MPGHPFSLVLAVARYADQGGQAPKDLTLAWDCQRYHCLPKAGGLEEQLVRTMARMRAAQNVYDAMSAYHAADRAGVISAEWMQRNRTVMNIAAYVLTQQSPML